MRLPFSGFVNDLLENLNRTPGQIHPIGLLNITIFQVACKIAIIQATIPLFGSLLSANHMPLSLSEKLEGQVSKNFLDISRPNKVQPKQFHSQWFFIQGGIGPRVPISWTIKDEVGSLSVRDTAFIKSQIQALVKAIPVKPTWTTYCKESSLIMAGLIHDKMSKVEKTNQNASDPTEVDVAAMKGRHFPCFNNLLVIGKPLVSGSGPIPIFPAKRSTSSEGPASASKCTKVEALENINAPSLTPTTSHTKVISSNDELTVSPQETGGAKKKKYALSRLCSFFQSYIPFLTKFVASSKKDKYKSTSSQGEDSSLDWYTSRYMKAPYTLPNGLSNQKGDKDGAFCPG
ncbi:hypothetical protein LIER_15852 [Lithospermum erythrorhizon]|uniref:Uncharacterized protein n=1 Tax=Lithospermum erythrorhizon TaxID=34254 RepID=A0AAV3Q620_LITER